MNAYTGELKEFQDNSELQKFLTGQENDLFVEMESKKLTVKQRTLMQVSKNDNRSYAGKRFLDERQKRNALKKAKQKEKSAKKARKKNRRK
jgi:TPP-dependent indolepyruvate ferredoxin oxidoreductase alpha subunit